MKIYNTLSRKIEEFKPLKPPYVGLYTCGPTVYDYTHLGHMKAYVANDLLRRTLSYLGYEVKHVMNITDVGHLTGDDDSGTDKLEKGAEKYKKTVWEVVKFYTDYFFRTTDSLNILRPTIVCPATDHIKDMIEMIKDLEARGLAYTTDEAVYYDVSKFPNYGKLSGQTLDDKLKGVRSDVYLDHQKVNSADFALWFKRVGRFAEHTMHWDSPWGDGFPGWHIECSAMSSKYLGKTIDIHTGGVDHIAVHHENEIAQSEGASGKQFVRFWFHYNFLMVDNQKMSKSLGNFYTIDDIEKKGVDPLALRYLFLQSHYRLLSNFTWSSLYGASVGLYKLKQIVLELKTVSKGDSKESSDKQTYRQKFSEAVGSDLQIPRALAVVWDMLKSNLSPDEKLKLVLEFDQVLGLNLANVEVKEVPDAIKKLADERAAAKNSGDFQKADRIRTNLKEQGFEIEDSKSGYRLKKI